METGDSNDMYIIKDLTHFDYKPINFSIKLWKLDQKFGIRVVVLNLKSWEPQLEERLLWCNNVYKWWWSLMSYSIKT